MKGSRLVDVLDDKPMDKSKWDIIFGKLKKLGTAIEMYYGPHIWTILYIQSQGSVLSKVILYHSTRWHLQEFW